MSCRSASFGIPLHIDTETFYIDAFLLDIGNDIDIILGTPWLASLGRVTWDFSTMEFEYHRNRHPTSFTIVRPRRAMATVPRYHHHRSFSERHERLLHLLLGM